MAKHHSNGTSVDIKAVEPVEAPASNVVDFSSFGSVKPQAVNTLTAQSVAFSYRQAITLRLNGIVLAEKSGLENAILAGDQFNSYIVQESLTARGGAELVEVYSDGIKSATIRAYGRVAELAAKVDTSRLLTVGSINNAQRLGFLTSPKISAESAKGAIEAFVAGTKINVIRESLNLPVDLDSLEGNDFLVQWGTVHLFPETEEDTGRKEKEEQLKAFKRIVKALDKHNLKEIVFGALLAEKAKEEDIESPDELTSFESKVEAESLTLTTAQMEANQENLRQHAELRQAAILEDTVEKGLQESVKLQLVA
jgi:hypothetical protein